MFVNVCNRTVRNQLREIRFRYRKAKRQPSLTPEQKKTRFQWAKKKWIVNNWMKVVFSDESRIALAKEMMLKRLFGAIPMKHIKTTA